MHQSVVFPRGGVSGIPTGFDSYRYLLPLGQEIDNNMRPKGGEFENLNLTFFIMRPGNKLKKCGQRQFWQEAASYFFHDFSGIFFYILFSLFGNRNLF
jgi:hypothetical protein